MERGESSQQGAGGHQGAGQEQGAGDGSGAEGGLDEIFIYFTNLTNQIRPMIDIYENLPPLQDITDHLAGEYHQQSVEAVRNIRDQYHNLLISYKHFKIVLNIIGQNITYNLNSMLNHQNLLQTAILQRNLQGQALQEHALQQLNEEHQNILQFKNANYNKRLAICHDLQKILNYLYMQQTMQPAIQPVAPQIEGQTFGTSGQGQRGRGRGRRGGGRRGGGSRGGRRGQGQNQENAPGQ